jgi:hypothetical protein
MLLYRSDSIHSPATATASSVQIQLSTAAEALNVGARDKLIHRVDKRSIRVPEEEFPHRAGADLAVGFPKMKTIRLTPKFSVRCLLTGIQHSRCPRP